MAKQAIIDVIEDVIGEYVLDLSKDSLRTNMVRGRITLENVQLDGDLIGSHVLGKLGLSGFGILSCSARKLRISIPWGSLERYPTKCEFIGLYLVCVPLLPSNAGRICGAGTRADPRCTLRTRAKRSVLARFERNFFLGKVLGEGPMKNKNRTAALKRKDAAARLRESLRGGNDPEQEVLEEGMTKEEQRATAREALKMKIKAKIIRNLEASMKEVHIRCEVAGGALEGTGAAAAAAAVAEAAAVINGPSVASDRSKKPTGRGGGRPPPERRPFAFGYTLDSFVVKSATSSWKTGPFVFEGDIQFEEVPKKNGGEKWLHAFKVIELNDISVYWDDDPCFMISESELLKSSSHGVAPNKVQSKISGAMEALMTRQDPGGDIRRSMAGKRANYGRSGEAKDGHEYCCSPFSLTFRATFSDKTKADPFRCDAELLPCNFRLDLRPQQYRQYQRLGKAMKEQHWLNKMMHKRPDNNVSADPNAWWRYAIASVVARPDSRPWRDVQRIVSARPRYVELVTKKILNSRKGTGYHAGLSAEESNELLAFEDLLPIESLLAFHLLASRDAYATKTKSIAGKIASGGDRKIDTSLARSTSHRSKSSLKKIKKVFGSNDNGGGGDGDQTGDGDFEKQLSFLVGATDESSIGTQASSSIGTVEAIPDISEDDLRLNVTFKVQDWDLSFNLLNEEEESPFVTMQVKTEGSAHSFGLSDKGLAFDLKMVEITSNEAIGVKKVMTIGTTTGPSETLAKEGSHSSPETLALGVACRISMSRDLTSSKLSLSSRPASVVYSPELREGLADFISSSPYAGAALRGRIRDAATPLSYRAQVAMKSPKSFYVNMNIDAPKLWIPVTAGSQTDGAFFVDAGRFKADFYKKEKAADAQWKAGVTNMNVKFSDGISGFVVNNLGNLAPVYDSKPESEITVISPFTFSVLANMLAETGSKSSSEIIDEAESHASTSNISVTVSTIYLNLVDAHVLARAIARYYASGVIRMKERSVKKFGANSSQIVRSGEQFGQVPDVANVSNNVAQSSFSFILRLTLDQIQMSLDPIVYCGKDIEPSSSNSSRTYLVDVMEISFRHAKSAEDALSHLSVGDLTVLQNYRGDSGLPHPSARRIFGQVTNKIETKSQGREPPLVAASYLRNIKDHVNEVDFRCSSFILVVSPETLGDCARGFGVALQLGELMTKEMERKIHREGRLARKKREKRKRYSLGTSITVDDTKTTGSKAQVLSKHETSVEPSLSERIDPIDSTLVASLGLGGATIVVGDWVDFEGLQESSPLLPSDALMIPTTAEIRTNALVMFQSIENDDGSGTRTLHISLDDFSFSIKESGEGMLASESAHEILNPFAAEFRIVYLTQNLGSVVSQDFSAHCASLAVSLSPRRIESLRRLGGNVLRSITDSGIRKKDKLDDGETKDSFAIGSFIRYKKKGTGIATQVRLELGSSSLVLFRPSASGISLSPLFDFSAKEVKASINGCISALSGEISALFCINYHNAEIAEWEYAIEPFKLHIELEQMPDEVIVDVTTGEHIRANLTSILLSDAVEMNFSVSGASRADPEHSFPKQKSILDPNVPFFDLARKEHNLYFCNDTGIDLLISAKPTVLKGSQNMSKADNELIPVAAGAEILLSLDHFPAGKLPFLVLAVPESGEAVVGKRRNISGLGIGVSNEPTKSIHSLLPVSDHDILYPEVEPVTEWCTENQRLHSTISDVYDLERGVDFLSSCIWSPGDNLYSGRPSDRASESIKGTKSASPPMTGYWVPPFLDEDRSEWTDLTCSNPLYRDQVTLPNDKWVWANEWTVDMNGNYSETTDADGWDYATDFDTFTRVRRFYKRGDFCRRRKWSRTRIFKSPLPDISGRSLPILWETKQRDDGGFLVKASGLVSMYNRTDVKLMVLLSCISWPDEQSIGIVPPGESISAPIAMASATHMRLVLLGKGSDGSRITGADHLEDNGRSDLVIIVPTSYESSRIQRAFISSREGSDHVSFHFLVESNTVAGVTEIFIEPVLRVLNLLPCHLSYRVGETGKNSPLCEQSGRAELEPGCVSNYCGVNPRNKPHISIRLPGYDWSRWRLVTNRKLASSTWLPPGAEEEKNLFHVKKGEEGGSFEDLKTIVKMTRFVEETDCDPLAVIMSIETGHCPTIRFYAQYWILDKSGFGLRFVEGFEDMQRSTPSESFCRRSHFTRDTSRPGKQTNDLKLSGHEWSIGKGGMTIYFSPKERISLAIEHGKTSSSGRVAIKSQWSDPVDLSNVMPKNAISVEESNGEGRFDLSLSVALCPSIYSRTKLVTIVPRYQILNLLPHGLSVAQDGCLKSETCIFSQQSSPFHWKIASLRPTVRLRFAKNESSLDQESTEGDRHPWTSGSIQLDRVGITSIRLPLSESKSTDLPDVAVVQVEIRLAEKNENAAVVVVVRTANEDPLYLLRNKSSRVITCHQILNEKMYNDANNASKAHTSVSSLSDVQAGFAPLTGIQCGIFDSRGSTDKNLLERGHRWTLPRDSSVRFGFDDPERRHLLEWTCVDGNNLLFDENQKDVGIVHIDEIGSTSVLTFPDGRQVRCCVNVEVSTKVIEFSDVRGSAIGGLKSPSSISGKLNKRVSYHKNAIMEENKNMAVDTSYSNAFLDEGDDQVTFSLRAGIPGVSLSIVDNSSGFESSREILLIQIDNLCLDFGQRRRGYHEMEVQLLSVQIDNHVNKATHMVLLSCQRFEENEPFLHLSAVRKLELDASTYNFSYVALRVLPIDIRLDRRTTETIARFIEPMRQVREEQGDPESFIDELTSIMSKRFSSLDGMVPLDLEESGTLSTSGRIYIERLNLHPIRIFLTFSQQLVGENWNSASQGLIVFQIIRGLSSIHKAPLRFTSFVVGHAFDSPRALVRILAAHYSSQLTQQIFAILGSLEILTVPADFLGNVGTGVRDFFYEPIQGMVQGPAQFIEGLEAGTQSLARGVFVGVVRSAANIADIVNSNLAGLTADNGYIVERNALKKSRMDARSRGQAPKSLGGSLQLAGTSFAQGIQSGAVGIIEQPSIYASKHGPMGLAKGMAKAVVGAVVKPVVGLGDAAVVVMNHVSDKDEGKFIPKRLRRALPRISASHPRYVRLLPFDKVAANAQRLATEDNDDVYLGHVQTSCGLLLIASERNLWILNEEQSVDSLCLSWEEISHFDTLDDTASLRVVYFSDMGALSYVLHTQHTAQTEIKKLLTHLAEKMVNSSNKHRDPNGGQLGQDHTFGRCNIRKTMLISEAKNEFQVISHCRARTTSLNSKSQAFHQHIDEISWTLLDSFCNLFSGLRSRRCIVAGLINGTSKSIQIKSKELVEGGSMCHCIPTREFDDNRGLLGPGGAIIFHGWGMSPNLSRSGNIFMTVETNAFVCDFTADKMTATDVMTLSGYRVEFLEKSYDSSGWWAKFWLMCVDDADDAGIRTNLGSYNQYQTSAAGTT